MPDITLYIAPGSCSRVPLIALNAVGVPFEWSVVRFMTGEHKSTGFKQINPKGKVPAVVIDGAALTENVAILTHLNALFPEAGLLPPTATPIDAARQIADLSFCSTTLHPLVTRIRMSHMFAGPEYARVVHDLGTEAMREFFALVEARLGDGDYWYGDAWSVMDAYLHWVFWRVEGAGFAVAEYPAFTAHNDRMLARPAVRAALAIEAEATKQLEAEGLRFTPPPLPA